VRRGTAAAALLAVLAASGCGGDDRKASSVARKPIQTTAATPQTVPRETYKGHWAARVLRRTAVRTRPAGQIVRTIGRRTEWKSPRYLAVTKQEGDWVGVITAERSNGHVGWVSAKDVELVAAPISIHVDLSERRAWLMQGRRTTFSFRVAVGQPDTPTPKGRFAVTDSLRAAPGSPYGCCILALSAHQPNIAQGWTGGDRIALHATPTVESIGTAASNGCLRTTDAVMRRVTKAVTLGATVFIRN
jgi:lipoprotein-anchoring transpeptidase ErfK/SrfK